jgi:hypothetical protein
VKSSSVENKRKTKDHANLDIIRGVESFILMNNETLRKKNDTTYYKEDEQYQNPHFSNAEGNLETAIANVWFWRDQDFFTKMATQTNQPANVQNVEKRDGVCHS